MASPPPNPDTRLLPPGWIQQYNWDYRQWFYVNTRENPPRSSWEHPAGLVPQGFMPPPPGPPPDRSYNRSPYGGPPPQQGYGGYQPGYGQPPPQGYYNNPSGGYGGYPQERVVYEERKEQKKGFGVGTLALAAGGGLLGGALLENAIEDHDEYERQEGFDQGYNAGFDNGYDNGFDNGFDAGF